MAGHDLAHRPKSFSTSTGPAVFADFTEAHYQITYDGEKRSAHVKATMKLNMVEAGRLVFDSVEAPAAIAINGENVTATELKTPSQETTVRVLDKTINKGKHTLTVEVPLKNLVEFTNSGVKSAFWTSDLSERQFLERYLPASFEYDRVKMTFDVSFLGYSKKHIIYTNGEVKSLGHNKYRIVYPDFYNASSLYFHAVPEGATDELRFSVKSVDGRDIPAVVYVQRSLIPGEASLKTLKEKTTEFFHELEGDYGAYLHDYLIVYNSGRGGMEYAGATITALSALGHEMFHFYFARGVMPANGNSGWVDEALASWRDEGYKSAATMTGTSRMSSRAYYTRTTDRQAYSFGERFMRYLNEKLSSKGGLKPFMRYMVEKRSKAPITVEVFIKEMEAFYGEKLEAEFRKFTYGNETSTLKSSGREHNHIHGKMTLDELKKIL